MQCATTIYIYVFTEQSQASVKAWQWQKKDVQLVVKTHHKVQIRQIQQDYHDI